MSLETQKKKNKHKYTLQPKTKTLSGARANGFGRQLIQKIRSIQKKNPNAQLTTDVQVEKKATKKVVKKQKEGLQNPAFDPFYTNVAVQKHTLDTIQENDDENLVKNVEREIVGMAAKKRKQQEEASVEEEGKRVKKKKKKNESEVGFVNNGLDLLEGVGGGGGEKNNAMEVKRGGGLTNPAFEEPLLDDSDLILNVTSAPPPPPQQQKTGYVNRGFNAQINSQQQRVINARNAMENCGAEVENDINEKRYPMVGEMDGADGENEKLEEGTKLRYKYASFSHRTPWFQQKMSGPKKSYKHLIKGDIILAFKNTNLHEIQGYAVKNLGGGRVVKPATFVTRSRAVPFRRPKPFVGYNSQQFVKSRLPRFQNQRVHQQEQFQAHDFGVNQGDFGAEQGNFDENHGNFEYNQQNFEFTEGNFGQNQENFDENHGNFEYNQQNFEVNEGNFGPNQENFDLNEGNFEVNQSNFVQNQGNFHQNFGPHQPSFARNQQNFASHQQNFAPTQNFRSNQQNFRQKQRNFGPHQQNFPTNQNFRPNRQNFPPNQQNFDVNQTQNQQFYPQNFQQQFPQNQRFSPMQRPKFMKPRRIVPSHNNQFYNKSPNGPFYNNQQGFQGGNGGYQNQQFYPQNNQQYN